MQISEEEKKAIEYFKYQIELAHKEIKERQSDEFKRQGTLEDIAKLKYCNLKTILNIIEKQSKEIETKEAAVQRLQELSERLNADNTELLGEIEGLKNDTYWSGYIDKQNEAVEICKQCKYIKSNKLKDKMIDLMSEQLAGMMIFPTNNLEAEVILGMPEEVKEYYRKEVEGKWE